MSTSPQLKKPAQVTNKPSLHRSESTTQPQTSLESGPQTRYTPAPQIKSGQHSRPRIISKELPPSPEPVHRPTPRPPDNI